MKDDFPSIINFTDLPRETIANTFLWGLIAQGIPNFISQLFLAQTAPMSMTMLYLPITPVLAVFFAPILEEYIFRRIIFGELHKRFNFTLSSIISSTLFAIGHFSLSSMLGYIAMGMVYCWSYKKTGKLSVTIIAHILMNLSVIIVQSLKG